MLDEKDLYHPLPDNLETGVSKFFHTKEVYIHKGGQKYCFFDFTYYFLMEEGL